MEQRRLLVRDRNEWRCNLDDFDGRFCHIWSGKLIRVGSWKGIGLLWCSKDKPLLSSCRNYWCASILTLMQCGTVNISPSTSSIIRRVLDVASGGRGGGESADHGGVCFCLLYTCKRNGLTLNEIYNANNNGLYWRCVPSRTLVGREANVCLIYLPIVPL